ncbi:MAG: 30S ribosomal protein S6 [Holosporaceae bacterium]|jgi:small subunit ribosomal protein S6|nr:30S ribosomal protein S6 [Holosporaceae bacterium]
MFLYEVIFIGRQDLSQRQMEALGVSLGLFVTQNNGEVVRSENCGLRNLAYAIKKNRKGHYYVIQIKVETAVVAELNRIMRINEDIIRHLIVKVDKFDNRDVLISQAKTFGDDFAFSGDAGYRSARPKSENDDFPAGDLVEEKEEKGIMG